MVDSSSSEEGLEYWLRWQVPVCALVIILPTIGAVIVISRVKKPHLNASDLWIPCWRGLSPVWLLIYRALVFCFMSWMLYRVASNEGAFVFYFYTQWTFTLVIVYFALGTIISAYGCWEHLKTPIVKNGERDEFLKRDSEDRPITNLTPKTNKFGNSVTLQRHDGEEEEEEEEEVNKSAGFWGYLMLIVYQTCAGAVMLTDVVFWCLLVPLQSLGLSLLLVGMHGLNLLFLLLDTALNNLPFPWFRMAYFVFWSCTYIVFQWVIHASGVSWWPYPFLELSTPWAPLWYLGVALVHIPCYGFYVLVAKSKNSLFSKLFPRAYLRSCS